MADPKIEWGQCLMHGIVFERCCPLFKPRKTKPFLARAMKHRRKLIDETMRDMLERYKDAFDKLAEDD